MNLDRLPGQIKINPAVRFRRAQLASFNFPNPLIWGAMSSHDVTMNAIACKAADITLAEVGSGVAKRSCSISRRSLGSCSIEAAFRDSIPQPFGTHYLVGREISRRD
jgi:hypothetical protein